jgi:lipopolysaccharide transport system ATP-binding protein
MSSEASIDAQGISKSYLIDSGSPSHRTFGEIVSQRLRHPLERRKRELFTALQDVSFAARPGEVIGVIGGNGAGKSTLLKILCRITEPTSGRAVLRGRVGSLLEVGTGFHPELTGRENIFLNGAILGMSRAEIQAQFEEIVEFSGIGAFLDTPVKRYSSGMYVRLAFSVAAHLQPEILLVDEVLAVGDADFQRRCLGKMEDSARDDGRTILFVSHNLAAVESLCTRGIHLRGGRVVTDGDVHDAVASYLGDNVGSEGARDLRSSGASHFRSITLTDAAGAIVDHVRMNGQAQIVVRVTDLVEPTTLLFGLHIRSGTTLVASVSSRMYPTMLSAAPDQELTFRFSDVSLMPGSYTVDLGLKRAHESGFIDFVSHALRFDVVAGNDFPNGYVPSGNDGLIYLRADVQGRVPPTTGHGAEGSGFESHG